MATTANGRNLPIKQDKRWQNFPWINFASFRFWNGRQEDDKVGGAQNWKDMQAGSKAYCLPCEHWSRHLGKRNLGETRKKHFKTIHLNVVTDQFPKKHDDHRYHSNKTLQIVLVMPTTKASKPC